MTGAGVQKTEKRVVCWFSAGAASAVATKLALKDYPQAVVVRIGIAEEHPDNERFSAECARWFGVPVTTITALNYADSSGYGSTFEVFRRERYLVGPTGAHCTKVLKKALREKIENRFTHQVFGYTAEEQGRVDRFLDANAHVRMLLPLVEGNLSKADCLTLLERAGIALPAMYRLGYANNNCVGCVKGGAGYWNKIRVDFPAVYERMAQMEEHLGRQINRISIAGKPTRVSLRQLPPGAGRMEADQPGECGIFCLAAEKGIES